jgi:hypothetical protein
MRSEDTLALTEDRGAPLPYALQPAPTLCLVRDDVKPKPLLVLDWRQCHAHGPVASVRGSIAENGTKDVSIRLIDADGEDIIPALRQQLPFEVKPPRLEADINIVANFNNVQFKKYERSAQRLNCSYTE